MSLPKIQQINQLEDELVEKEILTCKQKLFDLRLKKSTRQSFPSHSFRHLKHRLGQLLMIQKQRGITTLTTSKKRG